MKENTIAILALGILLVAGTATFGANSVLAQEEMVVPDTGIKQGAPVGVEEPMVVQSLPNVTNQAPLPPGKPPVAPIEEPAQLPAEETPVQTAAPAEECKPAEVAIITETNKTAEEVITVVENNVMNTQVVEEVTEVVENVTNTVEESVVGNATEEEVTEVVDEVVETVEETQEVTETPQVKQGLIQLLTELVASQGYNENLTNDERSSLKDNLDAAKQQLSIAFS